MFTLRLLSLFFFSCSSRHEQAVLSGCPAGVVVPPACAAGHHSEEEECALVGRSGTAHLATVPQDGREGIIWYVEIVCSSSYLSLTHLQSTLWNIVRPLSSSFHSRYRWVSRASAHPDLFGRFWIWFRGAVSFRVALLGEASPGSFWISERCGIRRHLPRKRSSARQSEDILQRSECYVRGTHLVDKTRPSCHDMPTKTVSHSCEMIHTVSLSHSLPISWQACQLGQHRPICKSHPEGVLKVGTTEGRSLTEQPLSDWFLKMAARDGNNEAFNKLKLFAQVCRYDLGNIFKFKTHHL